MTAFLTSRLCVGQKKRRRLLEANGFQERLRQRWRDGARVLVISADPGAFQRNDGVAEELRQAFSAAGFAVESIAVCDRRDEYGARRRGGVGVRIRTGGHGAPHRKKKLPRGGRDVLILTGGHVPSQNGYLKELELKRELAGFDGLLLAWSAGSMNCGETVYALPEREGEGADPGYRRFLTGLGLSRQILIPHFSDLQDEVVDGMRTIREMAYPDSAGRRFLCMDDGGYLLVENGGETLYGEASLLRDGTLTRICRQSGRHIPDICGYFP